MLASELVTRNAISVDQEIFRRLYDASARSTRPAIPSEPRWLAGNGADEKIVTQSTVGAVARFSRHRAILGLEIDSLPYLGLIGFEFDAWPLSGTAAEIDELCSGHVSLVLHESGVSTSKSALEVYDVVAASSRADKGYIGHAWEDIASLFPRIRLIGMGAEYESEEFWPCVLAICVQECEERDSWIESDLAESLRRLAQVRFDRFPYEAVSMSIFDLDPRSLFLALYRVIEATYAYTASNRVAAELSISKPWYELAEVLSSKLGWHPRHGDALHELLREASVPDVHLEAVCAAANVVAGDDLPASAGKAIRELRNRIVHYGPSMDSLRIEDYDWNKLCVSLLNILHVVFGHTSAAPA